MICLVVLGNWLWDIIVQLVVLGGTWGAAYEDDYAGFSSQPDSKYYDDYTATSSLTACNGGICYGHGLSEVRSWYGDGANFVSSNFPWVLRGGTNGNGAKAGAFYVNGQTGNDSGVVARSVLLLNSN